jgi:UDP-N-acetylmuramate dehydrogenase
MFNTENLHRSSNEKYINNQQLVIQENISLADKNTFKTGGNAEFFAEPETAKSFAQALQFAHTHQLKIFVLGAGANVLINDLGVAGLVIRPKLMNIEIIDFHATDILVKVGAGVSIDTLINFCLQNNIKGLEEFSGIPGTVGGAIYINLHYYEFLLEQFLLQATLINKKNGNLITVGADWFNFGYDQSKLQDKEFFVVDATFKLKKSNEIEIAHAIGRRQEIIRHRHQRYPYENTCGSFFRNFYPEEVALTSKKLIYVAYYLDKLGVKGELSFGGAVVSHQHANMIVNQSNGTSTDILNLTLKMQQMVYDTYSIKPQPECQLIGFDKNPFE